MTTQETRAKAYALAATSIRSFLPAVAAVEDAPVIASLEAIAKAFEEAAAAMTPLWRVPKQ